VPNHQKHAPHTFRLERHAARMCRPVTIPPGQALGITHLG